MSYPWEEEDVQKGGTGSMLTKVRAMFGGAVVIVGGSGDSTPNGCVK